MNSKKTLNSRLIGAALMTVSSLFLVACGMFGGASAPSMTGNDMPAGEKGVYFIEPKDGAEVSSPFKVKFGVKGMEVDPAGEQKAGKGHHHLLINLDSKTKGEIIPFDEKHMHFGKAQTEAEVKLSPGTYKLTMQMADGFHLSYGKEMAATIKVTVK